MTLQQLRYFLAMMETCSVSRAAAICAVTQPTLSVALRRLEEEFGTQLFVPDGRGLRPLPVARRLEAHVRSAVGAIAEARRELAQDRSRPLRIGLLPSLASAWLTGLSKVCDNHAEFTEAAADELERLVAGGRLDLALTAWSGRSGSNRHEVLREPYQLFVGPAHEFAGRRRVRIADLHSQAFVLRTAWQRPPSASGGGRSSQGGSQNEAGG
jgi:DNA-binding transcriptional LysR family regulator